MPGKKLDPIVSEFESEEEAEAYDKWFRAKIQASLDDGEPTIPHDEVMAQVDRIIAESARKGGARTRQPGEKLDPLVSEFETEEQAQSYDRWYRGKLQAALDDKRPSLSHDQVMTEMKTIIGRAENNRRKKTA